MDKQEYTYKQIIKSTSIFGGVQVINIIVGFLRAKFGAVLLGTAGIGIIGITQNIIDLIRSFSSLGIDTGAIRDIASNADDPEKQNYFIAVFRWWMLITATLGSMVCLLFCYPVSIWAFGNGTYAFSIALLSIAVFFTSISFGQSAILQGLRKIPLMAKSNLYGSICGLILCILCYYFFGLKGILPAFILTSIAAFCFTTIFLRKAGMPTIRIAHNRAFVQGLHNLKLGLFIVMVSVINTASMFIVRSFVNYSLDLSAVGFFTAAWTITTLYPALILRSMGTDYFPRLCTVSSSNLQIRRFVNEQMYIGILIMIPIVVSMIVFSRYILLLLYSSEFLPADSLLKWQIAGGYFKVLSWPVAFIMLAKGKGLYHLIAEVIFFGIYLVTGYILFDKYGLSAFGISYFLGYVLYLATVSIICTKISSFGFSRKNIYTALTGLAFIFLSVLVGIYFSGYVIIAGILLMVSASVYSIFMLNKVLNIRDLLYKIKKKIFP